MFRGGRLKCYKLSGTVSMYPWYGISHDGETSGKYPGQSGRRRGRSEGLLLFQRFHLLCPTVSLQSFTELIFYLLSATYILTSGNFILSLSYLFHRFPTSGSTCRTYSTYNTPVKCGGKQADFPCFSLVTFTKPGLSGGFTLWHR